MATFGENRVIELLKRLDKREYYFYYEPVIVTSNQSARRNPDFVIVSKALGVIVLEVKDYTRVQSITQKSIVIKGTNDGVIEHDNPVAIAYEYARNLSDRFQQYTGLLHRDGLHQGKLVFPWSYAAVLTNMPHATIQQAEQQGIWEAGSVIAKEDLSSPEAFENALRRIPQRWRLKEPLDLDLLNAIRRVINPELIVTDHATGKTIGTITLTQEDIIREPLSFDDPNAGTPLPLLPDIIPIEAEEIVQSTFVRRLRGVAGSGKTLVLARRAAYLHKQYPHRKMLVITFNVDLTDDLKHRIADNTINVINFHMFCRRILDQQWQTNLFNDRQISAWIKQQKDILIKLNLSTDYLAEEIAYRKDLGILDDLTYLDMERHGRGYGLTREKRELVNQLFRRYLDYQRERERLDWEDVPYRTLEVLENGHSEHHSYDIVLIDEAQDFAPSWFQVIRSVMKPGGHLFICDDQTQSIFRYFSWKAKGIDVVGKTRSLSVPFRCTRQISVAAHSLAEVDVLLKTDGERVIPNFSTYQLPEGDMPTLIHFESEEEEQAYIRRCIKDFAVQKSEEKFAVLCHSRTIADHFDGVKTDHIYVNTFRKMKGLEFHTVFVPSLHSIMEVSEQSDEYEVSAWRRKMFTAMTRARQSLIISYVKVFPTYLSAMLPHVQSVSFENGQLVPFQVRPFEKIISGVI
jgi:hypothetical protein